MSTESDAAYYASRAAQERARAERIEDPAVQHLHLELAALYESRGRRPPELIHLSAGL